MRSLKYCLAREIRDFTVPTEQANVSAISSYLNNFEPSFFELKIENNNPLSPAPSLFKGEDASALVYGTIDRVDTYKIGNDVYVRVVDYKTGNKSFNPKDLSRGENLQMFLYLKSVTETKNQAFLDRLGIGDGGSLIPAGVIYVIKLIAAFIEGSLSVRS